MKKSFIALSLLTLCSCSFSFTTVPVNTAPIGGDSGNITNFVGYYQANTPKQTLQQMNTQVGWVTSGTTGSQKMLIIPVQLSGEQSWTEQMLSNIEKVFFGETEETAFESVRSYFLKSSYGQLDISGTVISPFKSMYTKDELASFGSGSADEIIKEYYNSSHTNSELLKLYDKNLDGFVDNAIFIYSNPYDTETYSDAFWAWCSFHSTRYNKVRPAINNYMWASYTFLEDTYKDKYRSDYVEAHTYIHETGHLLGLDDYYCYDETNVWNPAGDLDMQAYNVGDHNIYSKLALGWIKPYVVTDTCRIRLKTSAKYPQAILIKDGWNGSTFDEYILVEYYTPTGLNEVDSKHAYKGRNKMYDYSGLRIYHIDARLAKLAIENRDLVFKGYSDEIKNDNYVYYVGASNSYTLSYLEPEYAKIYRYVHLLDSAGMNAINNGKGGTIINSAALWRENKVFSPSGKFFYNKTSFNDGTHIGYSVYGTEFDDESCLVNINRRD